MTSPTPAATTVETRAFDRRLQALLLGLGTVAVAAFLHFSARQWHGVAALVVLGLASAALVHAGGPAHRARRLQVDGTALTVERYTRVRTRVRWAELTTWEIDGADLVLVPRDEESFFADHPELRDVSVSGAVRLPLGARPGAADEVAAALP